MDRVFPPRQQPGFHAVLAPQQDPRRTFAGFRGPPFARSSGGDAIGAAREDELVVGREGRHEIKGKLLAFETIGHSPNALLIVRVEG